MSYVNEGYVNCPRCNSSETEKTNDEESIMWIGHTKSTWRAYDTYECKKCGMLWRQRIKG